jgi:hypothetical protein
MTAVADSGWRKYLAHGHQDYLGGPEVAREPHVQPLTDRSRAQVGATMRAEGGPGETQYRAHARFARGQLAATRRPVQYIGQAEIAQGVANLKAAIDGKDVEGFICAKSCGPNSVRWETACAWRRTGCGAGAR